MNGEIKKEIKNFIVSNYLRGLRGGALSDDDSFLEEGIIDSIGVIELAAFIQKRFGIRIKVPEIIPENFDTLNNLEKYINKKLKEKA